MKLQRLTLIFIILCACIFTTGCPSSHDKVPAKKKAFITIKGSDTLELTLNSLAKEFTKKNPSVEISIEGGGTTTGIEGLLNKTTDIAAASRPINDKELKFADDNSIEIKEHPLARDAAIIIINPENSIKALSLNDIEKIFTGIFTTWEETGGSKLPLTIYNNPPDSGTYSFFKEDVLKRNNFTDIAKTMGKPSDIIRAVVMDPGGIGYTGYQYYVIASDMVRAIAIKSTNNSRPVMPSRENIIKGLYPLSRTLYLYSTGDTSQEVIDFISFCTGTEGQAIINKNEAIPYQ